MSAPTLRATHTPSFQYPILSRWSDICEVLGLPNDKRSRQVLRQLHNMYGSPIELPPRGGQPKVWTNLLLEWWDELKALPQQLAEKKRNQDPSVAATYNFGRDAVVFPEIGGHLKKRRNW
jgi:hypothetical protein